MTDRRFLLQRAQPGLSGLIEGVTLLRGTNLRRARKWGGSYPMPAGPLIGSRSIPRRWKKAPNEPASIATAEIAYA
jgi:hypothetical protein